LLFSQIRSEGENARAKGLRFYFDEHTMDDQVEQARLKSLKLVALSDAFLYSMIGMVSHLSTSTAGQKFISSSSHVNTLLTLLPISSTRAQLSILRICRRSLPHTRPSSCHTLYTDKSSRNYYSIVDFFFYFVAASLDFKYKTKKWEQIHMKEWPDKVDPTTVFKMVVLLRKLIAHKHWGPALKSKIRGYLEMIDDFKAESFSCDDKNYEDACNRLFLTSAALCVIVGTNLTGDVITLETEPKTGLLIDLRVGTATVKVIEKFQCRVQLSVDMGQGKVAASFKDISDKVRCRFCDMPLTEDNKADAPLDENDAKNINLINVCNDPLCIEARDGICRKTLPCGHACGGVKEEKNCMICLEEGCEAHTCRDDKDSLCNICFTDSLSAMPTILLECSHAVHYKCSTTMLNGR